MFDDKAGMIGISSQTEPGNRWANRRSNSRQTELPEHDEGIAMVFRPSTAFREAKLARMLPWFGG
jgi:hypothetical protein